MVIVQKNITLPRHRFT